MVVALEITDVVANGGVGRTGRSPSEDEPCQNVGFEPLQLLGHNGPSGVTEVSYNGQAHGLPPATSQDVGVSSQ
jgi:hypothetical protein